MLLDGSCLSAVDRPSACLRASRPDHRPGRPPAELRTLAFGELLERKVEISSISDDGRFVAFDTTLALLPVDTNNQSDVYVRDLKTGKLKLASIGMRGEVAKAPIPDVGCLPRIATCSNAHIHEWSAWFIPSDPAISGNGRYVAFVSRATNIVANDSNNSTDVFVYDRVKGRTERVSVRTGGGEAGTDLKTPCAASSFHPSIDSTGRRVAFTSLATLSGEDENTREDVYVHDRKTNKTTFVSSPRTGTNESPCLVDLSEETGVSETKVACTDALSRNPAISGDGKSVVFESSASNLVKDDTNLAWDVFVRDLRKKKTERVSVDSDARETEEIPVGPLGSGGNSTLSGFPMDQQPFSVVQQPISNDGRFVAFWSEADDLVPNDSGGSDFFVRDRKAGRTERITVSSTGEELAGGPPTWTSASMSSDRASRDVHCLSTPNSRWSLPDLRGDRRPSGRSHRRSDERVGRQVRYEVR